MGIFDSVKATFQEHFDNKKKDREFEHRMRLEAEVTRRQVFEQDYKQQVLEIAKRQAHEEAAKKSGMNKLRAQSREISLDQNNIQPGSFFDKLRDYTQRNKARMEANLKRTAKMRELGKSIQTDRIKPKPFGQKSYIR